MFSVVGPVTRRVAVRVETGVTITYPDSGGGVVAWTPADLGAALALWLDAEDTASITLNGSNVSQWSDKSGNANHAVQNTAALQPVYSATGWGGKPSIEFAQDRLELPSNFASGTSLYFVAQRTGATGNQTLLGCTGPSDYVPIFSDGNVSSQLLRFAGINDPAQSSIYMTGELIKAKNSIPVVNRDALFDLAGSRRIWEFLGILPLSSSPWIGYTGSGGYAWYGPIVEIVASTNDSSTEERQKLEGYLAWKWGLEANLPADHPYKSAPPTV